MADTTPPTIAIEADKTALNEGSSAKITFTLSEPVTDFVFSDITYSGGTLSNFTGSGASYSATFTPPANSTSPGSVSVGNFKFSDAAGNANNDGGEANNRLEFMIDTVHPTISILTSKQFLGFNESATITFTLSEPSKNFNQSDITATNGVLSNFQGSGTNYTASFSPFASKEGFIEVSSFAFTDFVGNANQSTSRSRLIIAYDPHNANVVWNRVFDSASANPTTLARVVGLKRDSDGNLYVLFTQNTSIEEEGEIYLNSYDTAGNEVWSRLIYKTRWGQGYGFLAVSGEDSIYVGGIKDGSYDGGSSSIYMQSYVNKYTAGGDELWTQRINAPGKGWSYTAGMAFHNGSIYLAGATTTTPDGQIGLGNALTPYLRKFKSSGEIDWTLLLSDIKDISDVQTSIFGDVLLVGSSSVAKYAGDGTQLWTQSLVAKATLFDAEDNLLVGGSQFGGRDVFVAKFDNGGKPLWESALGSASLTSVTIIKASSDGAIYAAGLTSENLNGEKNHGGQDVFLMKFTPNGSVIWTVLVGTIGNDLLTDLAVGNDGFITLLGTTTENLNDHLNNGKSDAFVVSFAQDGTRAWTRLIGTEGVDVGSKLLVTPEGSMFIAGTYGNDNNTVSTPFLTKLAVPDMSIPTISITTKAVLLRAGQSADIIFTLSKSSANFGLSDLDVRGGTLSNFSGSETNYTATFIAGIEGSDGASVSVASGKFSDALGNFNEDGEDANNKVSFTVLSPTYAITSTSASVDEGSIAVFSLATTNIIPGVAIPYAVSGTGLTPADLVSGSLTGFATVQDNGVVTIKIPIAEDKSTEGGETLIVTVFDKSASVLIKDTSNNPLPTYNVTAAAASVSEGSNAVFAIATTNVAAGTVLTYTVSGMTGSDVVGAQLSGAVSIDSVGTGTVSIGLVADQKTEGDETLTLAVMSSVASIVVLDTSKDPPPTYTITASSTAISEGERLTFTLTTSNVVQGTLIPYSIAGITQADLAQYLSGFLTVDSDGEAILALDVMADKLTEGIETLTLQAAGQSINVAIQDTSTYQKLNATLKAATGEVVQIGKQAPVLQGYDPDWTKLTAGSLEQFNVNGRGNGDNVIRAINVMSIVDDPSDGRQVDPSNLGFWIEQIEEGTITAGDSFMRDILAGFVFGKDFRDLALKRMDTNADGKSDISYTKAAVQTLYRNVLGRAWADIVNDGGANWLVGEIDSNRITIVDVAERICLGAEAINNAVSIVGQQDLTFTAFGDGFGG
jgi:hypothetical protein